MRNTCILPGTSTVEEMIASVDDGYYLIDTGNGEADLTGEFMFGVTCGYEIKNGKLGRALLDTLEGKYMLLDEASVTGTANIVMAAVRAKGVTTIYNAACEPYLQQLCKMLVRMGAKIEGIGSNLLTITGVEELHGAEHRILPDMIEIGSFIALAAMNRSCITIKDVAYDELGDQPRGRFLRRRAGNV